jgi:V/A-type H+-transporting ATPase subunit D
MNLINLRRSIRLASKGHSLLKRKREVLVIEFLKMMRESRFGREHMHDVLQNAYKTAAIASTYIGEFELEQAGSYVEESAPIRIRLKNIMGVKIPEIAPRPASATESAIGPRYGSLAVNDVGGSFREVEDVIIEIAKQEQGLRRLVTEIDKVKRRVNALEYVLLPGLSRQAKYISMRLEEMDRDTFAGLKHVKKRLQAKSEQAHI